MSISQFVQRLQWCIEAAEAVALLHSYDIIHADINPHNMLLLEHLGLKLIDMSGSSIDGKRPLCLESTRYFLPRSMKDAMRCSVSTDLCYTRLYLEENVSTFAVHGQSQRVDVVCDHLDGR